MGANSTSGIIIAIPVSAVNPERLFGLSAIRSKKPNLE
jgi:hypothetical protein